MSPDRHRFPTQPFFLHDCGKCEFLGGVVINGERFDLYHHSGYYFARYSSDDVDYVMCRRPDAKEYFKHPKRVEASYLAALGVAYYLGVLATTGVVIKRELG